MRFQSSSSLFSPKKAPFSSSSSSLTKTPIHYISIAALSDDEWWRSDLIPSDSDGEGNPIEWWEEGHRPWQENLDSDDDGEGDDDGQGEGHGHGSDSVSDDDDNEEEEEEEEEEDGEEEEPPNDDSEEEDDDGDDDGGAVPPAKRRRM